MRVFVFACVLSVQHFGACTSPHHTHSITSVRVVDCTKYIDCNLQQTQAACCMQPRARSGRRFCAPRTLEPPDPARLARRCALAVFPRNNQNNTKKINAPRRKECDLAAADDDGGWPQHERTTRQQDSTTTTTERVKMKLSRQNVNCNWCKFV